MHHKQIGGVSYITKALVPHIGPGMSTVRQRVRSMCTSRRSPPRRAVILKKSVPPRLRPFSIGNLLALRALPISRAKVGLALNAFFLKASLESKDCNCCHNTVER